MKRFEKISGDSWVSGTYVPDQMSSKSHYRPTVIYTCRHTGRHTDMKLYKQTDTYTDGHIYPGRHRPTDTDRLTDCRYSTVHRHANTAIQTLPYLPIQQYRLGKADTNMLIGTGMHTD